MLSKNNKILIGCLALLLAMSVGYALFSDTIEINGSATAKGDFNLVTTCDMDASLDSNNSGSSSDAKISCEGNVVNASATFDYPGSIKWFRVMVKNEGTIAAKLKRVVELNDPENIIIEKDNYVSEIYSLATNEDKTNRVVAYLYSDENWYDDYETEPYGAAVTLWDEAQLDAVLDPGEVAYFYIQMYWSSNSTTPGEPLTASLNAQLDWEQVTQ